MDKLLTISLYNSILTILRMVSSLVIAKSVAIYGGPTGLAMLGQIQSLLGIANGIVSAPLGNGLVHYTARQIGDPNSCAPWWKASFKISIINTTLIASVLLIYSTELSILLFKTDEYRIIIVALGFAVPFAALNSLISSVINGQLRYERYILLGIKAAILSTCFVLYFIAFHKVVGALFSVAVSMVVSSLIMLYGERNEAWLDRKFWLGKTNYIFIKDIAKFAALATITSILLPLSIFYIRGIIINSFGWEQAGYWQAINKISDIYVSLITISFGTYYIPSLSSMGNKKDRIKEIRQNLQLIIPITIFFSIIVYCFGGKILTLLYDEKFSEVGELLLFQVVGDVFRVMSWFFSCPLISYDKANLLILAEFIFSITFVSLSVLAISKFGLHGAPIAYALSYALFSILMLIILIDSTKKLKA